MVNVAALSVDLECSSNVFEELFRDRKNSKPLVHLKPDKVALDTRKPASSSHLSSPKIVDNALLTQQAVIKIVPNGMVQKAHRLAGQLEYISRDGELELERGGGVDAENGITDISDVVKNWSKDWEDMDARTKGFTYHLIASFPGGTDPMAAKFAAKEFAERLTSGEYGDRYKYVIAHHDDTKNLHSHIIINRAGNAGNTLHISRYGVSVDDLRDLHVEVSRTVGIHLNATSRFSRGVDNKPRALGRIKAAQEGRVLPVAAHSAKLDSSRFPMYGHMRRTSIDRDVINKALILNINSYKKEAERLTRIGRHKMFDSLQVDKASKAGVIVASAYNTLKWGGNLERDIRMDEINQEPAIINGETYLPKELREELLGLNTSKVLGSIDEDINKFYTDFAEKIKANTDEPSRTQAEIAFVKSIREHEPLMNDDTKAKFAQYLVRDLDRVEDLSTDPALQRKAALDDIQNNRTSDLETEQTTRVKLGQERLTNADRNVVEIFTKIGMDGDFAVGRIKQGREVDAETRQKWFERDVTTFANANNLSNTMARETVKGAYIEAAQEYGAARQDIRGINRTARADLEAAAIEKSTREAQDSKPEVQKTEDQKWEETKAEVLERNSRPLSAEAVERKKQRDALKPMHVEPHKDESSKARQAREEGKRVVRGTIVEIGEDRFDKDNPNSQSPYIDLKEENGNTQRVWAVAVPDLVKDRRLGIGDTVTLHHVGDEDVTVKVKDEKTGEIHDKNVTRKAWEVSNKKDSPEKQARYKEQREREERDRNKGVSR